MVGFNFLETSSWSYGSLREPGGLVVKNPPASVGGAGLIPASGRSPEGGNKWQPSPVLLPEKSHEQGSLVGLMESHKSQT